MVSPRVISGATAASESENGLRFRAVLLGVVGSLVVLFVGVTVNSFQLYLFQFSKR